MEKKNEPRDPSLALCQICANSGDVHIYAESMDGKLTVALTCSRTTCNDFVPLRPDSLEWKKRELTRMSSYGRFD